MSKNDGIIKLLDKRSKDRNNVEFKEEQPSLLSSNKELSGCSSLNIKNNFESEDAAIDYLASILVEGFLEIERDEYNNK